MLAKDAFGSANIFVFLEKMTEELRSKPLVCHVDLIKSPSGWKGSAATSGFITSPTAPLLACKTAPRAPPPRDRRPVTKETERAKTSEKLEVQ